MSNLTRVPAHANASDLLVSATMLRSEDRAARLVAVREAARKVRLDLVGLGADLVNTPAGPDRERVRTLANDMTKRLTMFDDWTEALESAQRLNYLDN